MKLSFIPREAEDLGYVFGVSPLDIVFPVDAGSGSLLAQLLYLVICDLKRSLERSSHGVRVLFL